MRVTQLCVLVTRVTLYVCVCLGLHLTLMKEEISGERFMMMIYSYYVYRNLVPQFR